MPTEDTSSYADTPEGNAARWQFEFNSARTTIRRWHERAHKVVDRYLDKAKGDSAQRKSRRRLNLFTRNTQTLQSLLYGKTPQVDVVRKYSDADDEAARVAGEMLQRLLNGSIEKDSDTYAYAMELCLEDRLLPGLGVAKCRYEAEFEDAETDEDGNEVPETEAKLAPDGTELAPAVPSVPKKTAERVEVDHVPWKKQLWSQVETFVFMRWWAFESELTREALIEKFGEEEGKKIPLNVPSRDKSGSGDAKKENPWGRAALWEIWDKDRKCVWYFVEGVDHVLMPTKQAADANENGSLPDPLGLQGFWPFARPLIANSTTSAFMPEPDYAIAQDLYEQIDDLETRIFIIQKAIKVRFLYDGSQDKLSRLLQEGSDNDGIPIKNWAAFSDKGGLAQAIQFMPLDMLVSALQALQAVQDKKIELVGQVSGVADIMRGESSSPATATEQRIKGMFGSAFVQRFQDEFARFCSDTMRIKAEIISLHFAPETILAESNIQNTPDAQYADVALQLIKSNFYQYRVQVKPESVSLTDFVAQKQERQDFVSGLAEFMTAAAPLAQQMPGSMPFLLKLLGWYVAGLRGSAEAQGIIDAAVAAAENQPPQPQGQQHQQPDPKVIAQQQKAQGDLARIQAQSQADMQKAAFETQQLAQRRTTDAVINVKEEQAKQHIAAGLPSVAPGAA